MGRALVLVLVVIGGSLVGARPASASCSPSGYFVTPGRGPLPPNPTLWVFAQGEGMPAVNSPNDMRVGPIESHGDLRVRRLRFRIDRGALRVRIGERSHVYWIDPERSAPRPAPRIERVSIDVRSSCAYTDAVVVEVHSNAPVFEVTWSGGRTLLPGDLGLYFEPHREHDGARRLPLGWATCFGLTVPGGGRPEAEAYEVTAVYPDGSRTSPVEARLSR